MIFVTVGTQLPFDRLVQAVDRWVYSNPGERILAQIGRGARKPLNMPSVEQMSTACYEDALSSSELIVSHAGVGVTLAAIRHKCRLIVMPRVPALNEHRSDHQLDLCERRLSDLGVGLAADTDELAELLDHWRDLPIPHHSGRRDLALVRRIQDFISAGPTRRGA